MQCSQIGLLIEERLSLKQCLLIRYLLDQGGVSYVYEAAEDMQLGRQSIERSVKSHPHLFKNVELEKLIVSGGTQPFTLGVSLTKSGQIISDILCDDGGNALITCTQLSRLIKAGLKLRHCLLICYLAEHEGVARVRDTANDLAIPSGWIERQWSINKGIFEKRVLPDRGVVGASRGRTASIALTPAAKVYANILSGPIDCDSVSVDAREGYYYGLYRSNSETFFALTDIIADRMAAELSQRNGCEPTGVWNHKNELQKLFVGVDPFRPA